MIVGAFVNCWLGGSSLLPPGLPSPYYDAFVGCMEHIKVDRHHLDWHRHGDNAILHYCDDLWGLLCLVCFFFFLFLNFFVCFPFNSIQFNSIQFNSIQTCDCRWHSPTNWVCCARVFLLRVCCTVYRKWRNFLNNTTMSLFLFLSLCLSLSLSFSVFFSFFLIMKCVENKC